jgi:excisionase family DNA binding protein
VPRRTEQLSLELWQQLEVPRTSSPKERNGKRALPRLCVKPEEAAEMLGVSRDYLDEHIKPELRIIRRGSRTILIPISELVRWLEQSAAR